MSFWETPTGTMVSLSRKHGDQWGVSVKSNHLLSADDAVRLAHAISEVVDEARRRNAIDSARQREFYCTYCDFYSRRWDGRRVPNSEVYVGTRAEVIRHAECHPIGDPQDMALPVSKRAPYRDEE